MPPLETVLYTLGVANVTGLIVQYVNHRFAKSREGEKNTPSPLSTTEMEILQESVHGTGDYAGCVMRIPVDGCPVIRAGIANLESPDYVEAFNSLVDRGYLAHESEDLYRITQQGRLAERQKN